MDNILKANEALSFTCYTNETSVAEPGSPEKINSTDGLTSGNKLSLKSSPEGKPKGSSKKLPAEKPKMQFDATIKVRIKEIQRKKFLDFILQGMNVSFDVAIDFTSSNLDPHNPDSLHTVKIENNKYCKAINSCGEILSNYDRYQIFQVFGFGGVPKNGEEVSHCFNLNNKKNDAGIKGLDQVINAYKESINTVEFVGPTYFHLIIKNLIEVVKKTTKKDFVYHVFLILTDGKVEDMNETLDILVEASKLPISIIIVGIGNGDFGKMDILGKQAFLKFIC